MQLYSRTEWANVINESLFSDLKDKFSKLVGKISNTFKSFFSHPDVKVSEEGGVVVGKYKVDGKNFVEVYNYNVDKPLHESLNEDKVPLTSTNREIIDITQADLLEDFKFFYKNRKTKSLFLWGAPGIGKTDLLKQFAKEEKLNLVIINTSIKDPTDFAGLPSIDKETETTKFNLPAFFPRVKPGSTNAESPGILFFDELNAASQSVLVSCQQLILDRKLDNYIVPDNWQIVAAGNRSIDNPMSVKTMSAPLSNRFVHYNFVPTIANWEKYFALIHKNSDGNFTVHPMVLQFLKFKPEWFHNLDTDKIEEGAPWASPRSWTSSSDAIYDLEENGAPSKDRLISRIAGYVGKSAAAEFGEYYMNQILLEKIKFIFTEPDKLPKIGDKELEDLSFFNAMMDKTLDVLKTDFNSSLNVEQLGKFVNYVIKHFDKKDEHAVTFLKKILAKGAAKLFRKYEDSKNAEFKGEKMSAKDIKDFDTIITKIEDSFPAAFPK